MVQTTFPMAPRVGLQDGDRILPATAVLLRGHEVSLVVPRVPDREELDVLLEWERGQATRLATTVRSVEGDGRIAHLDIVGVSGDWASFVRFLGQRAA